MSAGSLCRSGAFGQSNVCYAREQNGHRKNARWMRQAVDYVVGYAGGRAFTSVKTGKEMSSLFFS